MSSFHTKKYRIAYALSIVIGKPVKVKTHSGDYWFGLLKTWTPFTLVLANGCSREQIEYLPKLSLNFRWIESFWFDLDGTGFMEAGTGFETDDQIARRNTNFRPLERWVGKDTLLFRPLETIEEANARKIRHLIQETLQRYGDNVDKQVLDETAQVAVQFMTLVTVGQIRVAERNC
jgi:hypothetical protein